MGRVTVRLTPRASADEIKGSRDGMVLARVTAPPVDGRANRALIVLVAGRLGIAKSKVRLIRGATGREKVLEVDGLADDEIAARLAS